MNVRKPSKIADKIRSSDGGGHALQKKGTKSKKGSSSPPQETEAKSWESNKIPKKRSVHVPWKRINLRDNVWNLFCRKITKTTLQAKDVHR